MSKTINYGKLILNFVYGLIVLIFLGYLLDLLFAIIPADGVFGLAIKLLKLVAPGAEDVAKLILDVIYAALYAVYKK